MAVARSRIRLTERQHDLARLVADGLTNRQIAEQLGIAEQTVRHTLVRVYATCGVPNRTALARLWLTGALSRVRTAGGMASSRRTTAGGRRQ